MIYFKADFVTVKFEEELKLVSVEWHGLVQSYHYRETLEMVLDLIEEKELRYFLIDRRSMARISLADEKWREESWYPRFLHTTIHRTASVTSADYYSEVSLARLIENQGAAIAIKRRSFEDPETAMDWLLGLEQEQVATSRQAIENPLRIQNAGFLSTKPYRFRL